MTMNLRYCRSLHFDANEVDAMGLELTARACGTGADILEYIMGKGGMLVCDLRTDDNGSDGKP